MHAREDWKALSESMAFVGNSLLAPMNQTAWVGLAPEFWNEFPTFGDSAIAAATAALAEYAVALGQSEESIDARVSQVSVEYTRLFIGPPKPAAAPWESAYRQGSTPGVGFGQAAHEMRALYRAAGLETPNDNHQYADHIGLEVLYASVLCARIADEPDDSQRGEMQQEYVAYCTGHPLVWIDDFSLAVSATFPSGYFAHMPALAAALLVLN